MVWLLFLVVGGNFIGNESQYVGMIELNTTYNRDTGQERFTQWIYWGRNGRVLAWHMDGERVSWYVYEDRITVVRETDNGYQSIKSFKWKRTYTFYDPEAEDRRWLLSSLRKPLLE